MFAWQILCAFFLLLLLLFLCGRTNCLAEWNSKQRLEPGRDFGPEAVEELSVYL
jgi:hypothetical protein